MGISAFEEEVLGWLLDDYESPQSLARDVGRELKRFVSEAEIDAALHSLVRQGYARAFVYETEAKAFRAVVSPREQDASLWFLCTSEGRAFVEDGDG